MDGLPLFKSEPMYCPLVLGQSYLSLLLLTKIINVFLLIICSGTPAVSRCAPSSLVPYRAPYRAPAELL